MKNYYAILEVPVGCPVSEIRESYRRLVQENLWNKETFAELKEAYEILTTPARRNEYDRATFGETFPGIDTAPPPVTSDVSLRENARHCPMGMAVQCPVINARVPLQETYCPECGFLLSGMDDKGFEAVALPDPKKQTRLEDAAGRVHTLRPGMNSVGREATDVLLPDKTVSRRHAQIEMREDGVAVEDLGSTNGTRVNGQMLAPGTARPVVDEDQIQFGSIPLTLYLPDKILGAEDGGADGEMREAPAPRAQLVSIRGEAGRDVPLVPGVTTFGRRSDNSVVLRGDPFVSGSHAQIIAEDDVFRITDLGSTNGTRVNDEALTAGQPRELSPGDEVAIGGTTFRFDRLSAPDPTGVEADAGPTRADDQAFAGGSLPDTDETVTDAAEQNQTVR